MKEAAQTRWPAGFRRWRRRVWVLNSFFFLNFFSQISSPSSPLTESMIHFQKKTHKQHRSTKRKTDQKWRKLPLFPSHLASAYSHRFSPGTRFEKLALLFHGFGSDLWKWWCFWIRVTMNLDECSCVLDFWFFFVVLILEFGIGRRN